MVGWFDLASSAASPCLFGTFALDPLDRLDAVDVHCTVQSTQSLSIVSVASLLLLFCGLLRLCLRLFPLQHT